MRSQPPCLRLVAGIASRRRFSAQRRQSTQVASFTTENADEGAVLDDGERPATSATQVYFGIQPMGGMLNTMQPWSPNDPIIVVAPADAPPPVPGAATAAPASAPLATTNETIASKGEVTGEGHHPKSPAERLDQGLTDKTWPKAEKCLANADLFPRRAASRWRMARSRSRRW